LNNDVNIQPIPTILHTEIKGTPTKKSIPEPKIDNKNDKIPEEPVHVEIKEKE
jgi:hypothetical protein